jgi:hypothetical protein
MRKTKHTQLQFATKFYFLCMKLFFSTLIILATWIFTSCILDSGSGNDGGYGRSSSMEINKSSKVGTSSEASSSQVSSSSSSSSVSSSSSWEPGDPFPTWDVPFTRSVSREGSNPVDVSPESELEALGSLTLEEIITPQLWENLFPNRAGIQSLCHSNEDIYSYDNFLAAAEKFPAFASEGPDSVRIREVAAFLANISHETTGGSGSFASGAPRYYWGLCWTEELTYAGSSTLGYRDASSTLWPPVNGVSYHGRGPIQITWNFNYGAAGDDLNRPLLHQPEMVAENGIVSFESALWFWMKEQYPKPSPHDAIIEVWEPSSADQERNRWPGFGVTINIINGGGECGLGSQNHPGPPDRIGYFERYTEELGTSMGRNTDCYDQRDFTFQ